MESLLGITCDTRYAAAVLNEPANPNFEASIKGIKIMQYVCVFPCAGRTCVLCG